MLNEFLLDNRKARNAKPGRHRDSKGLYLVVKPSGARSWVYRYFDNGTFYDMGLGGFPSVRVGMARERAAILREIRANGGNPMEMKRRGLPGSEDLEWKPTERDALRVLSIWDDNVATRDMRFEEALDWMRQGRRVKREGWDFHLAVPDGQETIVAERADGDAGTWDPAVPDLLARDWRLVWG